MATRNFAANCCRYALAALLTGLIAAPPAPAETRALLAGVWKFQSSIIPDLEGPENDLSAMEALIRGEGARDVTVLRNDGMTRTTFETALHALGLRAKPGDWIFIYYSGHGAEAEAAVKGTADGDSDQFLPLAAFDPDHQDPDRFIVDKDLYAWIARYVPRDVQVFMVADACHSGTLHRSIDQRAWRFTPRLAFRNVPGYQIKLAARPAPRFPSILAGGGDAGPDHPIQRAELPNEIYIGAAQDDQLALEASMPVEGAPSRGLLTYSFEQALTQRGADGKTLAADTDRDGKLSVGELAIYLDSQVRALTGQRQESSAHYATGADRLALFETLPKPPSAPSAAPLPAVWITGPAAATAPIGWRSAPARDQADFVWDQSSGAVLRRSGDVVAEKVASPAQLAGVIEKWGAMDALRPLLSEKAARLTLAPGPSGARYAAGSTVTVGLAASASSGGYATVFNLASDGTVQRLYPLDADGDGRMSGATLPVLENRVVAPFGVDHVVAVVTPTPPQAFRAALRTAEGQRGAGRLVAPIKALLAADPGAALSIGELYTGG